jgi:hypothetical protein
MKDKRCKKDTSKNDFYFTLLMKLKENKSPSEISKELKISRQKIYYYTTILKKIGFIEKSSYGKWEVKRCKKEHLEHTLNWKDKNIRGHAVIWKIKPNRKYDWKLILERNNMNYKLVRGYTPRIFINNKKVWLGKENIIIYETKSFYGKNAIQSRKYAVFELQETMRAFQRKMGVRFNYYFKPTREHFGMIKNELARQCNKKGEKIIVRDDLDGEWFWIDDSEGMMGEMETGGKGLTKDRAKLNMEVQNWWNDMKKTDFKVTPSFLMEKLSESNNNFNEIGSSIKKSSELMIDSEMRWKQLETRLRGQEELIYQLIEVIKKK